MNSHVRGVLLLVLVTAIWGSTFAIVKTLGTLLEPPVIIAWRFTIAALALAPALLFQRSRNLRALPPEKPAQRRSLWRDGLPLGAWLMAGYGTQTVALQTTTANRAAFFTALSVVLVPIWLVVAQRRRMPVTLWIALPLAVLGLGLLSWEGGKFVTGDAWALACAFTYAGFILTLERLASRHPLLPFTMTQLLGVTVFAWLWAVFTAPSHLLPPAAAWLPLIYLGIMATALTTLLQTVGQRQVSAAEASLIYALEPVTATLFSFLLIHEKVGVRGLLGGLLVVAATVLSSRSGQPHAQAPAPAAAD